MDDLLSFVRAELIFILIGLALVVTYQMLTGKIHLAGLLTDDDTGEFSVSRLQVLIVGFVTFFPFLDAVLGAQPGLPEIPEALLLFLAGGSNALYLSAKASPLVPNLFGRQAQ